MRAYWKVFNPFYLWARHKEMKVQHYRHRLVASKINNGGAILDVGGTKRANIGIYLPNYTVTVNNRLITEPDLIADGCDLPFKDNTFPNVVSIAVIHQVKDQKRFVDELVRVASERVVIFDCQTGKLDVIDV